MRKIGRAAIVAGVFALSAAAQESEPQTIQWTFRHRLELRANYRDSRAERFQLRFPFRPDEIPAGQTAVFLRTVDEGRHVELSVAQLQLDASYGSWLTARAKVHVQDKYRRNPTSSDRQFDADELFIRIGPKPEFLERPPGTSFFAQVGKAPKMERQPIRLLESYGLASTSFNRFEDVQLLVGGSVGRNLYWRAQLANGNPLFFRDPNALAGDNGTPELRQPNPVTRNGSGFPILYNAEVEGYFFRSSRLQFGQGLGYRWQRADESAGFDLIAFHYRRDMDDRQELSGTFYGADLDLLDGTGGITLPLKGRKKEETGARIYSEWRALTAIAQFTKQNIAGLYREGWEFEAGYRIPLGFGPQVGGESLFQSIQPAVRYSGITNRFRGMPTFVSPSIWWQWTKYDAGIRIGFARNVDLTLEHARQNIGAPRKIRVPETLVTLRVRV